MTDSANTSKDSSNLNGSDFNMKHRLTGAGLLISLGVVILPWLLGSYSISADGEAVVQKNETQKTADSDANIADNSIKINDDEDIKVFVSKIKPVDAKGRQIYKAQKASTKESVETNKKAVSKSIDTAKVEKVKKELESSSDKKISAEKTKKEPEKAKEIAKVDKVQTPKVKTAADKKEVEQGYIVSVGVYLKQDGANRVIKDLKSKGFKPSSSESKSSKGLATRVWLGPFLTRAAAGKERSKLEQVIGEKGWIIRYP